MGYGPETVESTWFTDVTDLILNSVGETRIEVVTQCAITVSLNLGRDSIEVDHIVVYMMGVLHAEMIELVLGIGNAVVWTECGLELYDELMPACHPQGACIRVIHSQ